MREENYVIIMLKSILKCQSIKSSHLRFVIFINIARDIVFIVLVIWL